MPLRTALFLRAHHFNVLPLLNQRHTQRNDGLFIRSACLPPDAMIVVRPQLQAKTTRSVYETLWKNYSTPLHKAENLEAEGRHGLRSTHSHHTNDAFWACSESQKQWNELAEL